MRTCFVSLFRACARLLLAAVIIVIVPRLAISQTPQSSAKPDRGVSPSGTYALSDIERINLTNGNLNLSIPLASLPPIAGGKLFLGLGVNYNSKLWDVKRNEVRTNGNLEGQTRYVKDIIQQGNSGGWRIGGKYEIRVQQADQYDFGWLGPELHDNDYNFFTQKPYPEWVKVQLITPDGATHELRPVDYTPYQQSLREFLWGYYWETPDKPTVNNSMRYYSSDGSYIWARIHPSGNNTRWEVYLPDGTHVIDKTNFQRIVDTNGNSIKIRTEDLGGGVLVEHYEDENTNTPFRSIKHTHTLGSFTQTIEYQKFGGTPVTINIQWAQKTVVGQTYNVKDHVFGTNTVCDRIDRFDANLDMITEIDLPETEPGVQRKFTFSYNSDPPLINVPGLVWWTCEDPGNHIPISASSYGWGSLNQMNLPSDARINYTYENNDLHWLIDPSQAPRERLTAKTVTHDNNTVDQWTYSLLPSNGTVFGPDGSKTTEFFYNIDPAYASIYGGQNGLGGLVYRTIRYLNNQPSVTVERHWRRLLFLGGSDLQPGTLHGSVFNPVVDAEYTTLHNAAGAKVKMSAKTYVYDYNGNLTSESNYDWFNPSDIPGRDAQDVPTGLPPGLLPVRVTSSSYHNPAPVGTDPGSPNVYAKRAVASATPLILNAPKELTAGTSSAPLSKTRFHYDGHNNEAGFDTVPTAGNVTKERRDKDGTWIDTLHTYDSYGNLLTTTDPKGNTTTLAYDSGTHAQPVSVTVDPDPAPEVTGDELTTTIEYDYWTGLVKKTTDPNGNETITEYDNQLLTPDPMHPVKDPFGRPGKVIDPLGRRVITLYHDNARQVETKADLKAVDDGLLKSKTSHDKLGRVVKVESSENGSTYTLITDMAYEQMGKITYSSNPHRSGADSTDGWTRTTNDSLGRVVEVATFNGAARPAAGATNWNGLVQTNYTQTSYLGSETTVTDQANKVRRSITDGLGRLVRVDEPDGDGNLGTSIAATQPTSYSYDALGNLLQCDQGDQHRYFTYDSLSRLRTAKNPEQVNGSTQIAATYDYDDSSNLTRRTNPNATFVDFTYDGMNRVKTKTISTGGLWDYTYDTVVPNGKARLTSVVLHDSTDGYYFDRYDAMGRVTESHQITTAGTANSYTMMYQYNLAGGMTQQTYPSGKIVITEYDDAGRIAGVKRGTSYYGGGSPTDATNRIQYAAHGAIGAMKLGNGKWERTLFNARLQPEEIDLGATNGASDLLKLQYTYTNSNPTVHDNNGNVLSQTITAPKTQGGNLVLTQNYTYDALNRLSVAEELIGAASQWKQTYDIDRWSNRAVRNSSTYIPSPTLTPISTGSTDFSAFNQSTNRLAMSGFQYDISGNLRNDPNTPGNGIVYDAENHQTSYTRSGVGATTYGYDGDGRRVRRTDSNNNNTIFVYNVAGQLIAEYTSGPPSGGGTSYLTSDHLGSTRVVTKADGSVKARYDYLPFGEEIDSNHGSRSLVTGYGAVDSTRQRFTQKERDTESGLDYFLARYYSSAQGRFTSPDELSGGPHDLYNFLDDGSVNPTLYADIYSPQSFNKYDYCYNNPLLYVDPDGHQGILDKAIEFGKQTVADTVNGGLKTAYNAVMSGPNTVNTLLNAGLSATGSSFRFHIYEYAQAETSGEKGAMLAGDLILLYVAAKASTPAAGVEATPRPAARTGEAASAETRAIPTEAYNRTQHYGRTPTAADRRAIGGESVDHQPPLVRRYYEGDRAKGEKPGFQQSPAERRASASDRTRMRPATKAEQHSQGGRESHFSRQKKREHGLN